MRKIGANRPVITMLPSVGLPDSKQAATLMAPVILSIWEHGERRQIKPENAGQRGAAPESKGAPEGSVMEKKLKLAKPRRQTQVLRALPSIGQPDIERDAPQALPLVADAGEARSRRLPAAVSKSKAPPEGCDMSEPENQPASVQAQQVEEDAATICDVAEQVRNGGPLDWRYWASRSEITPLQAAKLAHCIDPIKWPDDQHAQGPFNETLRMEIQRKAEWLAERSQEWTLVALTKALGKTAPYAMYQAAWPAEAKARQEEVVEGMRKAGRYTLEVAAAEIERNTGENAAPMLAKLMRSAKAKELPRYAPNSNQKYTSDTVREFYDEVHWDELNAWLAVNEPRIGWRFPDPAGVSTTYQPPLPAESNGYDWKSEARKLADQIGQKRWDAGQREITARNIDDAVATKLAEDSRSHGQRGPRSASNVRKEALKGWKFTPPKRGATGASGAS